jgi:2-amino-4-hydroxy-6-hydroxymethyldihydropteridine diphosphokinase
MARFVLLLGSNQTPAARLAPARNLIEKRFGILRLSPELQTPDRDTPEDLPPYLNQALETASYLTPLELKEVLREMESECGRERPNPTPGLCAMDIDIALQSIEGKWQVIDAKAVRPNYAQAALADWAYDKT